MNASNQPTQTSAQRRMPDAVIEASSTFDDEDFAIGCECANPALQIESWAREPVAQQFHGAF